MSCISLLDYKRAGPVLSQLQQGVHASYQFALTHVYQLLTSEHRSDHFLMNLLFYLVQQFENCELSSNVQWFLWRIFASDRQFISLGFLVSSDIDIFPRCFANCRFNCLNWTIYFASFNLSFEIILLLIKRSRDDIWHYINQ